MALQVTWANQVSRKEGLIKGCFCVVDTNSYAVQAPTNSGNQNAYYNSEDFGYYAMALTVH
ncbi:hypothetical protein GN244_ATG08022 [Phytophthora infestans]|uniref:Uncharacterized protein n=1 Tax=Phytophthora infestans TaxID=4787 RepID=A0A833T9Z9_PHYIN|nr:hypothetical protein GN244_ATG08022 [Phytophthora infestans]